MRKNTIVPQHKLDYQRAKALSNYSLEELRPYIMDIMEWGADVNWPIYKSVTAALLPYIHLLEPEILTILEGPDEDDWWATHLLNDLVYKSQMPLSPTLKEKLEQIAYYPTFSQTLEDTDTAAQSCLERGFWDWNAMDLEFKITFKTALSKSQQQTVWEKLVDLLGQKKLTLGGGQDATYIQGCIDCQNIRRSEHEARLLLHQFIKEQKFEIQSLFLKYISVE